MEVVGELRCQYLAYSEELTIPITVINRPKIKERVNETFGPSKLEGKVDENKILQELTLTQGSFEKDNGKLLTIELAKISRHSIFVVVAGTDKDTGTTQDAILMCEKLTDLFSRKKGAWSEFYQNVAAEQFGSQCKVKLDFPFHDLLKEPTTKFLFEELKQHFQLPDAEVIIHPFSLRTKIHLSPTTTDSDLTAVESAKRRASYDFAIEIGNKDDYDKRHFTIFSELPYDKHLELIKKLESMLTAKG